MEQYLTEYRKCSFGQTLLLCECERDSPPVTQANPASCDAIFTGYRRTWPTMVRSTAMTPSLKLHVSQDRNSRYLLLSYHTYLLLV